MIPQSLSARLLLASVLVLPVFLGLSGYMLDIAFQRSLRAAEAERLKTHIYLLLGAAELEGTTLWLPENLTEPRFAQLGSGLYGLVQAQNLDVLWQSPSSALLTPGKHLLSNTAVDAGNESFYQTQLNNEMLFAYHYDVSWDGLPPPKSRFRFTVLHSQTALTAELQQYRLQLWRWLGALAIVLLLAQALVLRWGLHPLRRLAADLAGVESGKTQQLLGVYPDEIQTVTDNLNQVLSNERAQRERYHNTLTDLAHSLKTPLAVIRGSLDSAETQRLVHTVDEQITRMTQIITHQLQRATLNPKPLLAQRVAVKPLVTRLTQALEKVYAHKGIQFHLDISPQLYFHGDERDLMEILGNLLENACKYGKQQVHCSADSSNGDHRGTASINTTLQLTVEDDGQGVPKSLQNTILQRGARADTATPGQGIGLAVVVDIVSGYGGSMVVAKSDLGGAKFRLTLPRT